MRRFAAAALALLLILAACAGPPGPTSSASTAPLAPSATAAPATATAAPATATPEPVPTAPPLAAESSVARFVYTLAPDGQLELRSATVDGGDDRLLAALPSGSYIPAVAVAPDGQTVAYVAARPDLPPALFLVTAGGDEHLLLEHRPEIALVGFSPDGTQLAYVRYRPTESMGVDGAIWVFPLGPAAWRDAQTLVYSSCRGRGLTRSSSPTAWG